MAILGTRPITGKPVRHRAPCDICNRVHRGRCTPADERSVNTCVTLPGRTHRRLTDLIPWGERSRFVAAAVEDRLDRLEDDIA